MTEEKGHSPIGASGYYRWRECPGSVRLCKSLPNVASVYAAQGSCAHWLGALVLKGGPTSETYLGTVQRFDGHDITVDQEMVDMVADYVAAVRADVQPGDELRVEVGFDLSKLYPELWGTADCVIYKPALKKLIVRDFKYGAGVAVEVEDNEQLKYYALGALLESGKPASTVELVINQPRCNHEDGPERRYEFDAIDLIDFQADLVDDAKRTAKPDAPLVPGDHCRWCPAKGACPALREQAMSVAQQTFLPVESNATAVSVPYDPKALAEALVWAERVEAWAKGVREFAYNEAMRGRAPPGFKLVAKRATRKWRDERDAAQMLTILGYDEDAVYEPRTLKSPTQVEKALGKKQFAAEMDTFVTKESSGCTLAPESDGRPAVTVDPTKDFTPIEG